MATFSLGNVASPINQAMRLAQLQEAQNPNLALEREIQRAVQLQQIQQQSPEGQLALQLRQAQLNSALQQQAFQQQQQPLILEQLRQQLDPNWAFKKQLELKAADPASGVVRSIPGFENQVIATPQALPPATQQLAEAGGDLTEFIGKSTPGIPITPIRGLNGGPSGFAQDFTIPQAIQARKNQEEMKKFAAEQTVKQENELAQIKARADAAGYKTYVDPSDPTNMLNLTRTEQPPAGYMEVGNYLRSIKASKSGAGGDLKPTGETQEKFLGGVNLLGQIDEALGEVEKAQKEGKFPNYNQTAINQFLTQRPQDIPGAGLVPGLSSVYAAAQRAVRTAQTPEARDLQMRRAIITSTILRTQAGLSQTLGETVNISPYTPSESDTYESLVDKLKRLRGEGTRSLVNYKKLYPVLRDFQIPGLNERQSSQQPSSGRSFANEAAARAAGFQNGDVVIIGGTTGVLE